MTTTPVTQTARDWAAAKGLCKAHSRGRLPNAAKDAIAQAVREGVVFLSPDYLTGDKSPATAAVRPSVAPEISGDESTSDEAQLALSKSARATQERLLALDEDALFEAISLRRFSFLDGVGHRVGVTVTGRRDLFRVEVSSALGLSITTSTVKDGWRTFPLTSVIKVGKRDQEAIAADTERRNRISDAKARRQDRAAA